MRFADQSGLLAIIRWSLAGWESRHIHSLGILQDLKHSLYTCAYLKLHKLIYTNKHTYAVFKYRFVSFLAFVCMHGFDGQRYQQK